MPKVSTFVSSKFNTIKMSKKVEDLVSKMLEKQYLIAMGAGKLGRWFGMSKEDVRYARKKAQSILNEQRKPKVKSPSILVLDIETAPIKAFVWRLWKENVSLDQISSDWFMLSWAAKWLYSADVISDVLTSEEAVDEDDSRIVASLWELLNKADIVIAHNGNSFDIPKTNARFIKWGLPHLQ